MEAVQDVDLELLEAWRGGDRTAGDRLFANHFDAIYGFFERRIPGDVSDIVQRTFLGLIEARDRMRGEASVRTFLYVIARRELYAHFAQQRRDGVLDFSVSSVHDLAQSPSSMMRQNDERSLLAEALRRIPVDLQMVLELHYWEGLAGPDIARVIDVPEGTVRSRLRRALEAVREQLDELGGGSRAEWAEEDRFDRWARALRPPR